MSTLRTWITHVSQRHRTYGVNVDMYTWIMCLLHGHTATKSSARRYKRKIIVLLTTASSHYMTRSNKTQIQVSTMGMGVPLLLIRDGFQSFFYCFFYTLTAFFAVGFVFGWLCVCVCLFSCRHLNVYLVIKMNLWTVRSSGRIIALWLLPSHKRQEIKQKGSKIQSRD